MRLDESVYVAIVIGNSQHGEVDTRANATTPVKIGKTVAEKTR
jgi:hypothetical protein